MKTARTMSGANPKGPYSHAIETNGRLLFIAGQGPVDPRTQEVLQGDFAIQAHQALDNLKHVAESAGGSLAGAVKVQVFLRDISHFQELNEIYSRYFCDPKPVRTTLETGLPLGYQIEIDAIIALD